MIRQSATKAISLLIIATVVFNISLVGASELNCRRNFGKGPEAVEQRILNNNFKTSRNFYLYEEALAARGVPRLTEVVEALPEGSIWLDSGAGLANAIRDVLNQRASSKAKPLKFLAVGVRQPFDRELIAELQSHSDVFHYFEGQPIQDMTQNPSAKLFAFRSQVSLLTDILGPLVYAQDIASVLGSYADLLKVGGQALLTFVENANHFSYKGPTGKMHRITLRDMQVLIPIMTGGRLKVNGARMNISSNGAPMFESTVLWLEKVAETSKPAVNPFRLTHISDEAPPLRAYEVTLPRGVRLNPRALRRQEIRLEDSRTYPLNIPDEFK